MTPNLVSNGLLPPLTQLNRSNRSNLICLLHRLISSRNTPSIHTLESHHDDDGVGAHARTPTRPRRNHGPMRMEINKSGKPTTTRSFDSSRTMLTGRRFSGDAT